MKGRKSPWRGHLVRDAAVALFFIGSASAHADQFGIQFGAGVADHDVRKLDFAGVWDPGLQWWHIGGFHFTLVGEAHAAYWNVGESGAVHPDIWEFGLTPVIRIIKDTGWFRPFFEAGIGVRLLTHARQTADRTMSSSFQFADLVGVGAQFGSHQNYQVGVRFQHLSNAGLDQPNPGANFSQIYVQYNF
jgi:hypothetical protein